VSVALHADPMLVFSVNSELNEVASSRLNESKESGLASVCCLNYAKYWEYNNSFSCMYSALQL
jgi:hypothetical protein